MPEQTSSARGTDAPYCLSATFRNERQAGRAYQRVQDLLLATEGCDLLSYRFYVGPTWYVAVIGLPPAPGLDQRLRTLLAQGTQTNLPDEVLSSLLQRRGEATKLGPWVEAHYGQEGSEPEAAPAEAGTPLPPELAAFLKDQQCAALLHGTDQGTVLVVKAPRFEIASVQGQIPIEILHELYAHPMSPVVRMVTRIYDQPGKTLALETYINVDDAGRRHDYADLTTRDYLLMLFYDEHLQHSLTKRVGGLDPEAIGEVLRNADRLLATIPAGQLDFDRAKADVIRRTDL